MKTRYAGFRHTERSVLKMDFWDTVKGYNLADSLTNYLPEISTQLDCLNKQLQKKEQAAIQVANEEVMGNITSHLCLGWRLISSTPSKPGFTVLVFELP